MDKKTRQQIALFRHGLIGDLVHRKVGERGLYALLRDKAERVYEIPGSRRTRVAVETLRDWLDSYRRGGFDALYPQPRRDQGQARAIPQEVADHLDLGEDTVAIRKPRTFKRRLRGLTGDPGHCARQHDTPCVIASREGERQRRHSTLLFCR